LPVLLQLMLLRFLQSLFSTRVGGLCAIEPSRGWPGVAGLDAMRRRRRLRRSRQS